MNSKYVYGLAIALISGLVACDDKADANGAAKTAAEKPSSSTGKSTATTSKPSKPKAPAKATCPAVIDKMVSFAPKEEAASAREIWNEMCQELTEDQRKCILGAKGTTEIDKCVDMKK